MVTWPSAGCAGVRHKHPRRLASCWWHAPLGCPSCLPSRRPHILTPGPFPEALPWQLRAELAPLLRTAAVSHERASQGCDSCAPSGICLRQEASGPGRLGRRPALPRRGAPPSRRPRALAESGSSGAERASGCDSGPAGWPVPSLGGNTLRSPASCGGDVPLYRAPQSLFREPRDPGPGD